MQVRHRGARIPPHGAFFLDPLCQPFHENQLDLLTSVCEVFQKIFQLSSKYYYSYHTLTLL